MASAETIGIRLAGLDVVERAMAQAPEIAREEMVRFFAWALPHLAAEVQDRTPTGEGHLRRSIIGRTEVTPTGMVGVVGTPLPYALPVELGTKPHPVSPEGILAIAAWAAHKLPLGQAVSIKSGRPLKSKGVEEAALAVAHRIAWKIRRRGSKGHFMFRDALAAGRGQVLARWRGTVQRIVQRMAGGA
ncbi:MAG TPA: hypothetical protein PKD29_01780 [Rhodocyclaceae bacterium]|nr:hypothetical protein [Rhodocyclaceae bacterium]